MAITPKHLFAVVVGIDKYDGGQQWQLTGPVADAVRFTNWLERRGVPADNIRLFLSPHEDSLRTNPINAQNSTTSVNIPELPSAISVHQADQNTLYHFLDESLRERTEPALIFFWGGHGMVCEKHGHQRLFCSDAKNSSRRNLDLESILDFLQTTAFGKGTFVTQTFIIDACAHFEESKHWTQYLPRPSEFSLGKGRRTEVDQSVVFATRQGHRADNLKTEATGLFSRELLRILDCIPSGENLPEFEEVFEQLWVRYQDLLSRGRAVPTPQYLYRVGRKSKGVTLGDVTLWRQTVSWLERMVLSQRLAGAAFDRDTVTKAFVAAWPGGELPTPQDEPAEWFLACFDILAQIPPTAGSQQWTLLDFFEFLKPEFRRLNIDFAEILAWAEPVTLRLGIRLAALRESHRFRRDFGWKDLGIPNELSLLVKELHAQIRISAAAKPDALVILVSASNGRSPPWATKNFPIELERMMQLSGTQLALRFLPSPKSRLTMSFVIDRLLGQQVGSGPYSHIFIVAYGETIPLSLARLLSNEIVVNKLARTQQKQPVRALTTLPILYRLRRLIALTEQPNADARSLWGPKLLSLVKDLHRQGLPHPITREFCSFRKADVTSLIAGEFLSYKADPRMSVANCTALRAIELERESGTLGGYDLVPLSSELRKGSTIRGARSASQAEVLRSLTARLQLGDRDSPDCVFVTGAAGVGKSILLRRFARNLAAQVLTSVETKEFLPIFIPLQQIGPSDVSKLAPHGNSEPVATWDFLANYWCSWATELIASQGTIVGNITRGWLDKQMIVEPTVLILDGIDEFLAKNRLVVGNFLTVLNQIRTTYSTNLRLMVVLGVRSTMPGLKLLTGNGGNIYEIAPLTIVQAELVFPGARKALNKIKNPKARELVLTPLILSKLGPRLDMIQGVQLETRSEILSTAVDAIVDRCASCVPSDFSDAYRDQWFEALAIVSWMTFSEFRGHISSEVIAAGANELRERWLRHLKTTQQEALGEDLMDGFRLLLDSSLRSHLLTRTVFQPIGIETYRFQHKHWEDFLVSRYLSHCVRLGFVCDLGKRAFLSSNFLTAGEMLGRDKRIVEVDVAFANRAFEEASKQSEEILVANAAAFIGNTWAPVTGECVRTFLEGVVRCSDVVRQVTLFTFYFRALRSHRYDLSSQTVRREVLRALKSYQTADVREQVGPLTARAAWAYQSMLASRFEDVPRPSNPWPGTSLSPKEKERALELVATRNKTGIVHVRPLHRSLQIAFTLIQYDALEVPEKIVGACLYLYALAAAAEEGALASEADQLLAEVLEPKSGVARLVASITQLPVLDEIFQYCKTLIEQSRQIRRLD